MQRGRVVSLKGFGLVEFLQKNHILLILLIFMILGIFIGNFYFDDNEAVKSFLKDYVEKFIALRTGNTFGKVLLKSFLHFLIMMFLLFMLGASLFGVVTLPIALFFKGFISGGIGAFLYSQYGLQGIAFNAVIFIPSTLLILIIMLLASRESLFFSLKISNLTLSKTMPQNLAGDFKDYCVKYLVFLVLTFCAAFVDTIISTGLIKNFSLI